MKKAKYNPRYISNLAKEGLEVSLKTFGVVEPIVWNRRSGNIVGGHQRFDILRKNGVTKADVVVVDLDEAEEHALNLTLNNPALMGRFTAEALPLIQDIRKQDEKLAKSLRLDRLRTDLRQELHLLDESREITETVGKQQFASEHIFCGQPLFWDTSVLCGFQCSYCYARISRIARPGTVSDPMRLRPTKTATPLFRKLKRIDSPPPALRIGVCSDPCQTPLHTSRMFEVMALAAYEGIVSQISTKNPADFVSGIARQADAVKSNAVLMVSFSTFDAKKAEVLEPRAPSPAERLAAMVEAQKMKIPILLRLQPYFEEFLPESEVHRALEQIPKCCRVMVEFPRLKRIGKNQFAALEKARGQPLGAWCVQRNCGEDYGKEQGCFGTRASVQRETARKILKTVNAHDVPVSFCGISTGWPCIDLSQCEHYCCEPGGEIQKRIGHEKNAILPMFKAGTLDRLFMPELYEASWDEKLWERFSDIVFLINDATHAPPREAWARSEP